jgi:hypothetical protein
MSRGLKHVGAKNTKTKVQIVYFVLLIIKTSAFCWNNNCVVRVCCFFFATHKYMCRQIINPEITRSQNVRHFVLGKHGLRLNE